MSEFLNNIHFMRPIWLILLIPAVVMTVWLTQRTLRKGRWDQLIDPALQAHMLDRTPGKSSMLGVIAIFIASAIAIVAVSGPSWQRKAVPVISNPDALVLLIDMSLSMNATDVAPDRATRAIRKATDIVRGREDGITAVIAYSGEAHTVVPFTDDKATVEHLLTSLSPEIMPKLGSRPDKALIQAQTLMTDAGVNEASALLITDGIQNKDVERIALALGDLIDLSLIAVGTAEGAPVPIGDQGFLKKGDGTIVLPKLDTAPMQALYEATGSRWRAMSYNDSDWRSLTNSLPGSNDANAQETTFETWEDAGYWLTFLLIPIAIAGFRRGVLFSLVLILPLLPETASANAWKTDNQQAAELMESDPARAAELFNNPEWKGTAHYRAGNYEAAEEAFTQSDSAQAKYNLGNARAQQGKLEQAAEAYRDALKADPDLTQAQKNLDFVEEAMKQQEQSSSDSEGDSENSDENSQNDQQQDSSQNNGENSSQSNSSESQNSDQNQNNSSQSDSNSSENSDGSAGQNSDNQNSDSQNSDSEEDSEQESADDAYADNMAEKMAEKKAEDQAQKQAEEKAGKQEQQQAGKAQQPETGKSGDRGLEDQQDSQNGDEGQAQKQTVAEQQSNEENGEFSHLSREQQAAMESVLNEVEDNPGLLMQRKFLYQYRQNADQTEEDVLW